MFYAATFRGLIFSSRVSRHDVDALDKKVACFEKSSRSCGVNEALEQVKAFEMDVYSSCYEWYDDKRDYATPTK